MYYVAPAPSVMVVRPSSFDVIISSQLSPSRRHHSRQFPELSANENWTSSLLVGFNCPGHHNIWNTTMCVCVCVCVCGEGWLVGFLAGWVARREDIEERKHTQQSEAIWICV